MLDMVIFVGVVAVLTAGILLLIDATNPTGWAAYGRQRPRKHPRQNPPPMRDIQEATASQIMWGVAAAVLIFAALACAVVWFTPDTYI